ncbi:MAG TPA: FecR family protein, partial [Myxococcaceae bacterium]|nr:FecR family protein [Myxococcaceae bacterium]
MSDDYLVDKRGTPEPDVKRLEELLADARYVPGKLRVPAPHRARRLVPLAIAASLLVIAVAGAAVWRPWVPSFAVQWSGPQGVRVGRLRLGGWLETDAHSRARVTVAKIGDVQLAPGSRLQLVASGPSEQRLRLERGALHAKVTAPPRIFIVDTPSAKAVDLGCEYQLSVDANGSSLLRVFYGAVSLVGGGVETRVDAGYDCETSTGAGPGLPVRFDAPPALRQAAQQIARGDSAAWQAVVANAAGAGDAPTLWHLVPRVAPNAREKVEARLGELARAPACQAPELKA